MHDGLLQPGWPVILSIVRLSVDPVPLPEVGPIVIWSPACQPTAEVAPYTSKKTVPEMPAMG